MNVTARLALGELALSRWKPGADPSRHTADARGWLDPDDPGSIA